MWYFLWTDRVGGVRFKEFMYVKESRTRSSFCTSTRINCCNKDQEAFCYITRENTRAVHEFSKLYKGQYFTTTVLDLVASTGTGGAYERYAKDNERGTEPQWGGSS